ncbi:MAG: glycosyltransferase family 2 protein [Solirubrobacteraceae bacterium]|nr:glycosyltransferase family 2 protein [Solirubrobacteraceae bacterium]
MSRQIPIWVVVPARDEALALPHAIEALGRASGEAGGPVHLVIVEDASVDATGAIARGAVAAWRHGEACVIDGPGVGVGWARRAGLDRAVIGALAAGEHDALIATTDADSRVPVNWVARLRACAAAGHAAIAGDVVLDPRTDARLVAARARRLERRLRDVRLRHPDAEHPHFAGANLACSVRLLASLAPLPAPFALEDDALGALLERRGVPILRDASFPVTTSGRLDGRAGAGLSQALRADALGFDTMVVEAAAAPRRPEPGSATDRR